MTDEPEPYIERSDSLESSGIRVSRRVVALCIVVVVVVVVAIVYGLDGRGKGAPSERIPAQAETESAPAAGETTPGEGAAEPGHAETQNAPAKRSAQDRARKGKHRPPRSKKTLLPSQQNREIHIVPKADIYQQIEEEE